MSYYKIGKRIRSYRKSLGISQEQLAEAVGISVTHMSHIETANTKLSLPVLIKIAENLHVSTDVLIHESFSSDNTSKLDELASILETCNDREARIIIEIARGVKAAIKRE
ncbi:MAG: helix-turn-helix transcriptional regulator [Clostridia bacterium]|nr:helix-turn-helix transcriptional regulator [Clostridia bacterium]